MSKRIQGLVAFSFGVTFVASLFILAVFLPNPSQFQYRVFQTILALAAAGVAAMIPGFLSVDITRGREYAIRAAGALAVFVVVYFFSPAKIALREQADSPRKDGAVLLRETERTYATPQSPSPEGTQTASETSIGYQPANQSQAVITTGFKEKSKVAELRGHAGRVRAVTFARDVKLLATAAEDGSVIVWNYEQMKAVCKINGYGGAVTTTSLSPDGRLLAFAGEGSDRMNVVLWNLAANKVEHVFPADTMYSPGRIYSVAFSHDGRMLGAAGTGPVFLWDIVKKRQIASLKWQETMPSYGYAFAFSPKGVEFAVGCNGGERSRTPETVRLWMSPDQKTPNLLTGEDGEPVLGHQDVTGALLFSPDGTLLVRATKVALFSQNRSSFGSLKIWKLNQQMATATYSIPFGNYYTAAFYGDTNLFVASAAGPPDSAGMGQAFNRNAPEPSLIGLWDSRDGRAATFQTDHKTGVTMCAISGACDLLATSGNSDYSVSLWNRESLMRDARAQTDAFVERITRLFQRAADDLNDGQRTKSTQEEPWRQWLARMLSEHPELRSVKELQQLARFEQNYTVRRILQSLTDEAE